MELWSKKFEKSFLEDALNTHKVSDIFYKTEDGKNITYYPKSYKGKKTTIQSRNSLIGSYTEKYCKELIAKTLSKRGLHVESGVICDEIGLTRNSPADVAVCRKPGLLQNARDIEIVFEVKMSLVWNWEFSNRNGLKCLSDYTEHSGVPGLLRSDSVLKAIGKSVMLRTSGDKGNHIPIIVLTNTPIGKSYQNKVDFLKESGLIQGFWSLNPNIENDDPKNIKSTPNNGFYRFDNRVELREKLESTISRKKAFFSSFITEERLGEIISSINKNLSNVDKAKHFLSIIRGGQVE